MKFRIAIFASGRGSNLKAIHESILTEKLIDIEIGLGVCDQIHAPVVEYMKANKIPSFTFSAKEYPDKNAYEAIIAEKLNEKNIDLVILAGYMRLIGSVLLDQWEGKMINLHPSLLPEFPGKDAISQAWQAGVKETGVTVHFVDSGMDTGKVLIQETVNIDREDTEETLAKKIHNVEHRLLPNAIKKLRSLQ